MKLKVLLSKYASNSEISHKQHEKSYVEGSTFKSRVAYANIEKPKKVPVP